jgi:hypothetical protein
VPAQTPRRSLPGHSGQGIQLHGFVSTYHSSTYPSGWTRSDRPGVVDSHPPDSNCHPGARWVFKYVFGTVLLLHLVHGIQETKLEKQAYWSCPTSVSRLGKSFLPLRWRSLHRRRWPKTWLSPWRWSDVDETEAEAQSLVTKGRDPSWSAFLDADVAAQSSRRYPVGSDSSTVGAAAAAAAAILPEGRGPTPGHVRDPPPPPSTDSSDEGSALPVHLGRSHRDAAASPRSTGDGTDSARATEVTPDASADELRLINIGGGRGPSVAAAAAATSPEPGGNDSADCRTARDRAAEWNGSASW